MTVGRAASPPPAVDAAAAPLVVATECPSCAAPLDFEQGTNAIHCRHCGSKLLVTGRHQVLSYAIAPRVDAAQARTAASADGAPRLGAPQLHLVPYYRLTGVELAWERATPARQEQPQLRSLLDALGADVMQVATVIAGARDAGDEVALATRRVERNFLACDAGGVFPYSLGMRPSVLRLRLFRPEVAGAEARIVAPTLPADQARTQGLRRPGADLVLHREALGCVLSIIYFPFWALADETRAGRLVLVDGTGGEVVTRDGDPAALPAPAPARDLEARTVGFRSLACPNCGWDVAADPLDVVFPCGSCHMAWRIVGDRLEATSYVVAAAPGGDDAPADHLPVWLVDAEVAGDGAAPDARRFLVPGFRCRALKLLVDLAAKLSAHDPTLVPRRDQTPVLRGCHLDPEDAIALARFLAARPADGRPRGGHALGRLTRAATRLSWLPFEVGPYALRDPFTGTSLPANLLT